MAHDSRRRGFIRNGTLALALWAGAGPHAAAEVSEIRIAQQPGLTYLPFILLEANRLVEKHAKAAGLGDVKVTWFRFSGGNVMNDALLSGNLDIANSGPPAFLTLWARTKGNLAVRGIAAYNSLPLHLNTRNPAVRSIRDLTDKDRIAVPAVRASMQAMLLQMEAERVFGPGQHGRLDALTVSRGHADAMAQLFQDGSEINAHFAAPPFTALELARPGIRTILTAEDVLGAPATVGLAYTTARFHDQNPKAYAAFFAALREAIEFIRTNRREAAEIFVKTTKVKSTVDEIVAQLSEPKTEFGLTPQGMLKFAHFLHRTGQIKERPDTWQDLFFPAIHSAPGS
jgi:NitT/TauT family transport system substrate-binding protein